MKMSDGIKQVLRPVHERPEFLRILDPIVGLVAGGMLVWVSTLGFAAFGMLVACMFVAYTILSRVFGVSFDFDPAMFQKYASAATH